MTEEAAARLAGLGIAVTETATHYLLVRGECLAVAERTPAGVGGLGSTGMLTEIGLAYLVWREGRASLAAKGVETPATAEQVETMRRFSDDVKTALGK